MKCSTLISATELNQIIDAPNLRLFDCRFNLMKPEWGFQQFEKAHIPNSQYADLNEQLAGAVTANTGRHPLPDKTVFQDQLREWGIDRNSQVVVYDDASAAIAARLWWMCIWAGIKNTAVLDGGIQTWMDSGFTVTEKTIKFDRTDYIADYDDRLWISTEGIAAQIKTSTITLTDARTNARYRGEQEPIDPIAGHIPTAINLPFDKNLNKNGHFHEQADLKLLHEKPSSTKQVVSMCGSGVTACHNILARCHAGLHMGKLYVGSWSEWITDSNRQIEKD